MSKQSAGQSLTSRPRIYYGYVIVIAIFIIMLVNLGLYFSIGVFFKPMLNEFGWTRGITSGAVSLSWIVGGLVAIILGRLNDRFGPRILTTVCGIFFGLGFLLMSSISNV